MVGVGHRHSHQAARSAPRQDAIILVGERVHGPARDDGPILVIVGDVHFVLVG